MITIKSIETLTNAELVTEYNRCAAVLEIAPVKRFSDRKSALRRVASLLAQMPEEKPAEAKRTRSEGIAASWLNPEVAAKRQTKNAVTVNDRLFSSTHKAFMTLGLGSSSQCIRFRVQLKQEGKKVFTKNGKEYVFEVVA